MTNKGAQGESESAYPWLRSAHSTGWDKEIEPAVRQEDQHGG
jgi:hypothetical protein